MKLATFASSLCPPAALLALVLLIGWAERTAALPFQVLSPPLHDENTYETVHKVSKQVSRQKAAGRERLTLVPEAFIPVCDMLACFWRVSPPGCVVRLSWLRTTPASD